MSNVAGSPLTRRGSPGRLPSTAWPPTARVFANRYELGAEVGRGGMADVYLARDRLLEPPRSR